MKVLKLYLLFLFIPFSLLAQQKSLEELKKRISKESDRAKVETYLDIAELDIPMDTALCYLDRGLEMCKEIKYDTIYQFYFRKGLLYFYDNNIQDARREILAGAPFTKYTKNPKAYAGQVDMLLGVFCESNNQQDSALIHYDRTITLLEGDTSKEGLKIQASTFTNKANILYKNAIYATAISLYIKASEFANRAKDYSTQMQALNNLASCFQDIKEYSTAIEYYKEVENIAKSINDLRTQAGALSGIGQIYTLQKSNEKAIAYLEEAEELCHRRNFPRLLAVVYQNMADAYLGLKNYQRADRFAVKSINLLHSAHDDFTLVNAYLTRSNLFDEQNKLNLSLEMADSAYYISKYNAYLELEAKSLKQKVRLFKQLKAKDSSISTYEILIPILDSIFKIEKIQSSIIAEKRFQGKRIKEKLSRAQKKHRKAQRNSTLIISILGAVLLLFLIGYFIQRARKKAKERELNLLKIELLNKTIDPHFINGVINSLASEIQTKAPNSYALLEKLSLLTRSILKEDATLMSLGEQINQAEGYLSLLKFQYPKRLKYTINCEVDNMEFKLPKLIIHNLLENSYKHTVSTQSGNAEISIHVRKVKSYYYIKVIDNGIGLNSKVKKGTGLGLDTYQRLFKSYNQRNKFNANISLKDREQDNPLESGVIATISIPIDYNFA